LTSTTDSSNAYSIPLGEGITTFQNVPEIGLYSINVRGTFALPGSDETFDFYGSEPLTIIDEIYDTPDDKMVNISINLIKGQELQHVEITANTNEDQNVL